MCVDVGVCRFSLLYIQQDKIQSLHCLHIYLHLSLPLSNHARVHSWLEKGGREEGIREKGGRNTG